MTSFFFSPHKDLLKHTLAMADAKVSAKHDILSAGTEVTLLDVGVIKFEPNTACDTSLVISCGVHGDETAPIEIANKIINDLLAEEAKCSQRVLFIFANPWAMAQGKRFADINMNRLFYGDWQHHDLLLKEVKRAAKLEAYVANFFAEEPVTVTQHLHYDCHTAIRDSKHARFAVYPFVEGRELPQQQQTFLTAAGVEAVVLANEPSTTFSSFSANQYQAESFTLELGKVKPFGENNLKDFSQIDRSLRAVIAAEPIKIGGLGAPEQYRVAQTLLKTSEDWQFHIADDAANFTEFSPQAPLCSDGDQQASVGEQPEYVIFPNANVPVGQRAALMLHKL